MAAAARSRDVVLFTVSVGRTTLSWMPALEDPTGLEAVIALDELGVELPLTEMYERLSF